MSKFVGLRIGAMHEEHTVSEYYCGGCGWPVTDHDSYCPECGGAFQESFADDALEVENAKLRKQVGEACMQLGGAWVRCTELRELVRVMAYCMQCERDCDGCAMNGADGTITALAGCDGLRDRMRELGVEVEGWTQ